jgi:YcxB-like protein
MTSGVSDVGGGNVVVELVQSRNASASEALAIFRAQMNAFKLRLAAIRGGRSSRVALVITAGVFGAILISVADSRWVRDIPSMYVIAVCAIFAAAALRVWVHYYYKRCAEVYRDCFKADRRFRIEEDAVVAVNASGVVSSIPWTAISDIVINQDNVMIYLSPAEAVSMPKAACENQDVERFCLELLRRWQMRRTRTMQRPWG